MLLSEVVILQNVVLVQCDVIMQSNWCQLCTFYSKVNVETIPTKGPYHEWINGMVTGLALPNWGQYEFLGGDGQKLLLAAMPVFWRGNGWFGVKFLTPTSTKIPLESSLQQLSIGAIKTWQCYCEMIRYKLYKGYSPTIQMWYDRIHAYLQLIRLKEGKAKNSGNILRFATRTNIQTPDKLTMEELKDGLRYCRIWKAELSK